MNSQIFCLCDATIVSCDSGASSRHRFCFPTCFQPTDMRTSEASSGTVLHRLIQEQLRYGNLTDTRTLLAIQQQALRGGSSSSGGGTGSPRSSLESLTLEETQDMQMSMRQEPQGQEHQGDGLHSEGPVWSLYQLHGEELPTYEEAKAHSQYLNSQREQAAQEVHDMSQTIHSSITAMMWLLADWGSCSVERREGHPRIIPSTPEFLNTCSATHRLMPSTTCLLQCTHSIPAGPPKPTVVHSSVSSTSNASGVLMRENERLRKELEVHTEKDDRLQKLEMEIQRISEAYDTLMKGSAKREVLEKTMRNKMEAEIKRMHDFNRDLREQLVEANKHRAAKEAESSDPRQHVFVKLLEQNEEQQREREHLEKQIHHLRESGEECQRRRELLEQALASAQTRNRQLEEELLRKRAYVKKVERLQSALAQLQAACEKREVLELRLRTRLEQELKSLRALQSQNQPAHLTASDRSLTTSQQQLREKEERILALEADITKWEQKYLEESTMRQFAMDAAATAAAQRDTTIINHSPRHSPNSSFNEDLPLLSHRHQEMENRIRVLHAQLLEKDAVIKVLQQRSKSEQGKPDKQGLRPARSVPTIHTVTCSTERKGKSLSDDQTGALVPKLSSLATAKGPSQDARIRSDVQESSKLKASEGISEAPTEEPKASLKSINSADSETIEILI
ncbi:hypothetical protein OJAV_G00037240 [Oryzias javanicus]|uniref:Angiomotin C-terminal domain-containing protein n=1 Tax=Oryzias javanicus TaxID=123683 RepID=A0A3S2PHT7_ORYJA|nr:hypothetical protein OJAV_G00037240 [Oryzias javanicus]